MIEGLDFAINTLNAHYASITETDERTILERLGRAAIGDEIDLADLAFRTCACGESIDGFYDYTVHIINLLRRNA